jgi:RHS repeat-associated protein
MSYGQGQANPGTKLLGSEARYLPFGDWRVEPAHDLTDQGFTGQKHNMDLGLYYYNARFYLPGIGRFASADTLVPDPTNPQQYNRYTYTLNNPLRFLDPSGHFSVEAIEAHVSGICGGWGDCIDDTLRMWQADEEWWGMLLAAEAGDILYGTYDFWGGSPAGSFFYKFLGAGRDRLDGIEFISSSGHGGANWLDRGFGLTTIFNGRFTIPDSSLLNGSRTVRMMWNGVVNNLTDAAPVYINSATSLFVVSRGEQANVRRIQRNRQGGRPAAEQVVTALATNLGTNLAVQGLCHSTPKCSLAFAGARGLGAGINSLEPPYSYAVYSGPYEFHFEWDDVQIPGLYGGVVSGDMSLRWQRTR